MHRKIIDYICFETIIGSILFNAFLKLLYDVFWMVGFIGGTIKRIFRRGK